MRFEALEAGEKRQMNGPWFGVRVLTVGSGARLTVNGIAIPLVALPAWKTQIDRIEATGPISLAVADRQDDDVDAASATPAGSSTYSEDLIVALPGGTVFTNARAYELEAPQWARRGAIWVHQYGAALSTSISSTLLFYGPSGTLLYPANNAAVTIASGINNAHVTTLGMDSWSTVGSAAPQIAGVPGPFPRRMRYALGGNAGVTLGAGGTLYVVARWGG